MQQVIQDLNVLPDNAEQPPFDLNIDLHPVIFNPAPDDVANEGMGQELHLLQPQGEVYILEPALVEEAVPAQENVQQQEEVQIAVPAPQVNLPGQPDSPANLSDDEIPYEQLLGSNNDSSDGTP